VWLNGTWHTWDAAGVGGENDRADTVEDAKREAETALVRQGWAHPARQRDHATSLDRAAGHPPRETGSRRTDD
jgi:hypothetical protein